MEEFTEVPMEQEMPAAEEPVEGTARDESSASARKETSDHETTDLSGQNNEIKGQDNYKADPVEAGGEDSAADFDGNEVPEEGPPEIDPAVYAGWQELAKAHPEVVGKPLPDDIMKACVESGLSPLRVHESMMLKKQGEQIAALQQEIATLRQNAEAAQRAPVTAASLGGNEGNDPNDEFLQGFNS